MHSFLLPEQFNGGETLILAGQEYHYLINVLRLHENDSFNGRDYRGLKYVLKIIRIQNQTVTLSCLPDIHSPGLDLPDVVLYQCICKGKKMDRIIRQATEAGVSRIIPVVSEYTIPRFNERDIRNKLQRWSRVVREAIQQSGSEILTEITQPVSLEKIKNMEPNSDINLYFHQISLENHSLHEYLSDYPKCVSLLIGPEGGLSEKETQFLNGLGFKPVLLRTNILRAETAAVYAIGAVQSILMEKETWKVIVR